MNNKLPFCKHCKAGYKDLLFDAYAEYDPSWDSYHVVDIMDKGIYCAVCDGETTVEWRKEDDT